MSQLDKAMDEILAVQNELDEPKAPTRHHAQGWEPGVAWNGKDGTIVTGALPAENAPNWDTILKVWGLDPEKFQVVEPVLFNVWGDPLGQLNRQWKGKVIQRTVSEDADMERLIQEIKKHKFAKPPVREEGLAMLVAISDLQLGKGEGGGTAGIVARFLAGINEVEARWKELVKTGRPLSRLVVVGLGDVVESCDGHYDMQAFQTDLDRREQITVARRLLVKAITSWARFAPEIIVAAIPGNHGENRRGGKAFTTFGDNDDVAVFEQAAEVVGANPDYDHVKFAFPKNDLTMTLDVCGTIVGLAHGHQFRGNALTWWAKQALGLQRTGDSSLLLAGHLHHLVVQQSGARTFIQAPSLDGGSQWFTETQGASAPAGILTMTVGGGFWDDLRVLPCLTA
jgi:predicted phosphodiesterase